MMQKEVRPARMVAMRQIGQYAKKIIGMWKDIWNMEGHLIKFFLCSIYVVQPIPTNLKRWKLTGNPCLEHNLSACHTSLRDGRFRW